MCFGHEDKFLYFGLFWPGLKTKQKERIMRTREEKETRALNGFVASHQLRAKNSSIINNTSCEGHQYRASILL